MNAYEAEIRNRKIAEQEAKRKEDEEKRLKVALANIVSTTDGLYVLARLLNLMPIESIVFDANPVVMAYNEGRRSVEVELLNILSKNLCTTDLKKLKDFEWQIKL